MTLAVIFVYFIVRTVQRDDKKCETVLNIVNNEGDPENQLSSAVNGTQETKEAKEEDPLLENKREG